MHIIIQQEPGSPSTSWVTVCIPRGNFVYDVSHYINGVTTVPRHHLFY